MGDNLLLHPNGVRYRCIGSGRKSDALSDRGNVRTSFIFKCRSVAYEKTGMVQKAKVARGSYNAPAVSLFGGCLPISALIALAFTLVVPDQTLFIPAILAGISIPELREMN